MKKPPKPESKESCKYQSLIQQFNNLEKEWKSLEKSRPRNPQTRSTHSNNSTILTSFDHLLENSPRLLMSNLQHSMVKKYGTAVEEIVRDKRAAIISGKLKGRRLFDDDGGGGEVCSDDWMNVIQEREVIVDKYCGEETNTGGEDESCSFSDSCPSEEKVVVEETVVEVAEKRHGGGGGMVKVAEKRCGGGGSMVVVAWFGFVLVVLVIIGVFCVGSNGKFVHESEFILVPT